MSRNARFAPWSVRRRIMVTVLVFSMGVIAYCLWARLESKVAEAAVTMAFSTLIGVTGSYVFGAAWEDISRGK